jgi:hypothetical protein
MKTDNDFNPNELKECFPSVLVAIKNYQNRIKYLEDEKKITSYKLNRIKQTTLYDLNKAERIIMYMLEND